MTAGKPFKRLVRARMQHRGESYARARRALLAEGEPSSATTIVERAPIPHPPADQLDEHTLRLRRVFPVARRLVWSALIRGSPELGGRARLAGWAGHVVDVDHGRRLVIDVDEGELMLVTLDEVPGPTCRLVCVHALPAGGHPRLEEATAAWHAALIDLDERLGATPRPSSSRD